MSRYRWVDAQKAAGFSVVAACRAAGVTRRPPSPPPARPDQADTSMAPAPDLLGRLFYPDRPDLAWCGDITHIPTDEGWLYLASCWSWRRAAAGLVDGSLPRRRAGL